VTSAIERMIEIAWNRMESNDDSIDDDDGGEEDDDDDSQFARMTRIRVDVPSKWTRMTNDSRMRM